MTNGVLNRCLIAASFISLAGLTSRPVGAQDRLNADQVNPVDIVVTARRVEETLQSVPVAVTALTAQSLEQRRVRDVTDLSQYVPNLTLLSSTSFGGSSTSFAFIRGVGQPEVFLQNDPGVGIYVDGVYVGRSQGSVLEVLDLARVEVLRGPQGTLYGRNTIGGAINLISERPVNKLFGTIQAEAGNYGATYVRGKANVPLSENLYLSVSAARRYHDGFVTAEPSPFCGSCTRDALSDENGWAGRVALRWEPQHNLFIDVVGDYTHKNNRPIGRRLAVSNNGFPPYDAAVAIAWGVPPSAFQNNRVNTSSSNFTGFDQQRVAGTSLTVDWQGKGLEIKSITGYRNLVVHHASDSDGSPLVINTITGENNRQHQLSQELQLISSAFDGKVDWLVGLFGMTEKAHGDIQQSQSFAEAGFPSPFNGFTFQVPNPCFNKDLPPYFSCGPRGLDVTDLRVTSLAAFANATVHLTDKIRLTGGARYNNEEKKFDFTSQAFGTVFHLKHRWGSLTPRVSLDYAVAPGSLLYMSYAQGFKSGTFNNGNDPTQPLNVKPEKVTAYEVGAKTSWWHERVTLNLAAFYSDYTNQQLQVRTDIIRQSFAFVNVGSSHIYGGELELTVRPSTRLRIDGSLGLAKSRIDKIDVNTPNVAVGARLVRTPALTANLGATYSVPLTSGYILRFRGDYVYRGSTEGDFVNNPNDQTAAYHLANARAELFGPKDRWSVYAFANNLLNEKYELAREGFDPTVSVGAVDGPPRTIGVGVRLSLGDSR